MILHIINKSPLQHSALKDALDFITINDTVIFIDDGVYAALPNTLSHDFKRINCTSFALIDDLELRGINIIDSGIQSITMHDFIELVFQADKTISWY
jgi:tRNA 2-thiouridine synthesizing protein B